MPVNGADVVETKFFKQRGGQHHAFGMLFNALGQLKQRRRAFEHSFTDVFGGGIKLPAHQLRQVAVERAHGGADAHVVVVENDQQIAIGHARVVERLKGHASGQCAVADNGNGAAVFPLDFGGQRHAQSGRNGGAGVRRAKRIKLTLRALGKATQTAHLTQRSHAVTPPGQNFVRVSLVAHIPHHPVMRGVEHVVQGHRELNRAQVGAEVTAGFGHAVEQISPQFI